MRKLIFKLTAVAICLITAMSCGKEDETPVLSTDAPSEIVFAADGSGGKPVIAIDTNQQEWGYKLNPADGNGWLTASSSGNELRLTAAPNPLHSVPGPVTIIITAGKAPAIVITSKQLAAGSAISIDPPLSKLTFSANGTITLPGLEPAPSATFTVNTNEPGWNVSLDPARGLGQEWLTVDKDTEAGTFTLVAKANNTYHANPEVSINITAGGTTTVNIIATQELRSPEPWDGSTSTEVLPDDDGVFRIYDATQLAWLSAQVSTGRHFWDKEFVQMNDIDLNGKLWPGIGYWRDDERPFMGSYDGNGYKITGLVLESEEDSSGLFGYVLAARLRNITVSGGKISGVAYVGGICAENYGAHLSNCVFEGEIIGMAIVGGICGFTGDSAIIENCVFKGTVKGMEAVGGIVGNLRGEAKVTGCINAGDVSGDFHDENQRIGGIIGIVEGDVLITACYNTGKITAALTAGGIAGDIINGTVTACYSTGLVTAESGAGGIFGAYRTDLAEWSGCYWLRHSAGAASGLGDGTGTGTVQFGAAAWPAISDEGWGIGSGDGSYWKSLGGWAAGGSPEGINSDFPKLYWE